MKTRVLCLVTDGFEEIEMVTPVDLLRRAGVEMTIVALERRQVEGRSGIQMLADAVLAGIQTADFDSLLLPGGPGVKAMRADGRPAELVREFARGGKWLAAICAAPLVLKDAGVLEGRRFTAHGSTLDELPELVADEPVVLDGTLITSRGAGTAQEFGLALVNAWAGAGKLREVAAAIHAGLGGLHPEWTRFSRG